MDAIRFKGLIGDLLLAPTIEEVNVYTLRPYDRFLAYQFTSRRARSRGLSQLNNSLYNILCDSADVGLKNATAAIVERRPYIIPVQLENEPIVMLVTRGDVMRELILETLGPPNFELQRRAVYLQH